MEARNYQDCPKKKVKRGVIYSCQGKRSLTRYTQLQPFFKSVCQRNSVTQLLSISCVCMCVVWCSLEISRGILQRSGTAVIDPSIFLTAKVSSI